MKIGPSGPGSIISSIRSRLVGMTSLMTSTTTPSLQMHELVIQEQNLTATETSGACVNGETELRLLSLHVGPLSMPRLLGW